MGDREERKVEGRRDGEERYICAVISSTKVRIRVRLRTTNTYLGIDFLKRVRGEKGERKRQEKRRES